MGTFLTPRSMGAFPWQCATEDLNHENAATLASCLRAAAHPADHFVAGNAVPVAEILKLLEVELIGHFPQRVVSCLRVTHVTQGVNQPTLVIRHLHP